MPTLVQALPSPMDKIRNLATAERFAAAAAALGSEMVVFPELFLTGYNMGEALRGLAEPLDGPSATTLRDIARRHGIGLVLGMPERCGEAVFNSVVAIDAEGRLAGVYRKIHLFGEVEPRIFTPGDRLAVAAMNGIRVGLAICYDIEFPETARALAREGCQLLCVPTANMEPYWEVPTTLVRARALENGLPALYANLVGQEGGLSYTGLSAIVAADGRDAARAGVAGEAVLHVGLRGLLERDGPLSTQYRDLRVDALSRGLA